MVAQAVTTLVLNNGLGHGHWDVLAQPHNSLLTLTHKSKPSGQGAIVGLKGRRMRAQGAVPTQVGTQPWVKDAPTMTSPGGALQNHGIRAAPVQRPVGAL